MTKTETESARRVLTAEELAQVGGGHNPPAYIVAHNPPDDIMGPRQGVAVPPDPY